MELRRLSICLAFFVLAVVSQCSEARHSVQRRATDYSNEDNMFNDGTDDDGTQNDANDVEDDAEPPAPEVTITSKPENYRLIIGRSVRLECKLAPENAFAVISWTKGGSKKLFLGNTPAFGSAQEDSNKYVLDSPSHDLIIKDLNFKDTGRYTCQVEKVNPISITHTVIVEEAPMISNPETTTMDSVDDDIDTDNIDIDNIDTDDNVPRIVSFTVTDTQPMEGTDLLFTCKVSGTPKPSLIWSRQRKPGSPNQSLVEVDGEFTDSTFHMKNVNPGDSGTYYCYAVNDAGNATQQLELTVRGKPHLAVEKSVINTEIGVETKLKCSSLYEPIHISWYKGDQIAPSQYQPSSRKTTFGTETTLTVTPSSDEDFGTFVCQAVNAYGSDTKTIELVRAPVVENLVSKGLTLTWTVHSHLPLENIELTLKDVRGGSDIHYDVPLPESTNKSSYELIYILNEEKLPENTYEASVSVKNSRDWSPPSQVAVVKIDEHLRTQAASNKPRVHVHRPVINSDIGIEAVLKCSTHDEPNRSRITWYKDDRDITGAYNKDYRVETKPGDDSTESTLIVIPKNDDDFGTFTCEAKNFYGSHRKSIDLVQRPVVESFDSEGPKLTWTVHSHQPLESIELNLQELGGDGTGLAYTVPLPETSGNKTHTYEISYVLNDQEKLQGKTFEATVKVKNNKDWSSPSEPVVVKIDSLAQSIQTASVLGGPSGAFSIRPSSFVLHSIMMYLLVRML